MDVELLAGNARNGDKEALLKLIMDKKGEYYRLAYVYTGNREDAMDAMEDMIVILYRNVKKLKDSSAFYSWSKTILVNCCKDIVRNKSRYTVREEIEEEVYERGFERSENRIDIIKSLKILNEGQQEAIKLKYLLDMDYESIAKMSNVPVGTVKSRLFTALKKLKESFGGEY
ncbi:RNA polymerase sigma factor SigV [Oxobacter pfennigii]|uniref:RNA polymerase sigma factor SigV n=1 Tax=Oxobacter pfennigii TaxID=36849 RepID=A0A0P8YVW6_9CLOT|nr:sigma-70 family RNA polymerase sigma factor [Oxobacter pfennigii]KPU43850.1 RNA polymerase sigma factor SigV [Oxobacter pfennigii]